MEQVRKSLKGTIDMTPHLSHNHTLYLKDGVPFKMECDVGDVPRETLSIDQGNQKSEY